MMLKLPVIRRVVRNEQGAAVIELAFALPALIMLLFWPRTTRQGVIASIVVGMISSLTWILLSGDTYASVYNWSREDSPVPFSQPGIVTIPLSFATLIVVSLLTRDTGRSEAA